MAGDWIKMRTDLHGDEAVESMAQMLFTSGTMQMRRLAIVGALHKFWSWSTNHTTDGIATLHQLNCNGDVTQEALREKAFTYIDGIVELENFAESMEIIGWLELKLGKNIEIILPKFDRHNSETAKERALTKERVKKHRGE